MLVFVLRSIIDFDDEARRAVSAVHAHCARSNESLSKKCPAWVCFVQSQSKVADALMHFVKQTIPQAQSFPNAPSSVPFPQIKQEARLYGGI